MPEHTCFRLAKAPHGSASSQQTLESRHPLVVSEKIRAQIFLHSPASEKSENDNFALHNLHSMHQPTLYIILILFHLFTKSLDHILPNRILNKVPAEGPELQSTNSPQARKFRNLDRLKEYGS